MIWTAGFWSQNLKEDPIYSKGKTAPQNPWVSEPLEKTVMA